MGSVNSTMSSLLICIVLFTLPDSCRQWLLNIPKCTMQISRDDIVLFTLPDSCRQWLLNIPKCTIQINRDDIVLFTLPDSYRQWLLNIPKCTIQIRLSLPSILNQIYQTKITGQSSQ